MMKVFSGREVEGFEEDFPGRGFVVPISVVGWGCYRIANRRMTVTSGRNRVGKFPRAVESMAASTGYYVLGVISSKRIERGILS